MNKPKLLLIIIIAIFISISMGITYSLFSSDVSMLGSEKIAKFIFETKELEGFDLPIKELMPGDQKTYSFSVTNTKESKQSDVSIEYQITIKTFHFMPLEIVLYDSENNVVLNCDETYERNEDNELVCKTENKTLSFDKTTVDKYQLEVSFPSEYNMPEYSGLVDFISLTIDSAQKMGENK